MLGEPRCSQATSKSTPLGATGKSALAGQWRLCCVPTPMGAVRKGPWEGLVDMGVNGSDVPWSCGKDSPVLQVWQSTKVRALEEYGEPWGIDAYGCVLLQLFPCKTPWALYSLELCLCRLSNLFSLPTQMSMVAVGSLAARIPEVHSEGGLLCSYFFYPFLRSHSEPMQCSQFPPSSAPVTASSLH